MRVLRNIILYALFFMGVGSACFAQTLPIRIKAAIDKKEATIGEKVRYSISVTADKNTDIEFPDLTKAFKDLTMIDSGESEAGFFSRRSQ